MQTVEIPISEILHRRILSHIVPGVDTYTSVLEEWLNEYEGNHQPKTVVSNGTKTTQSIDIPQGVRRFDAQRPPDLAHTTVHGELGTTPFWKWSDLHRLAHVQALEALGSFESLLKITRSNIKKGEHSSEGFKPISEIGLSIQGVEADRAWQHSLRLAVHLKIPLKAEIEWRDKDGAAFPGERGFMMWTP